jgi:hypothetical protein
VFPSLFIDFDGIKRAALYFDTVTVVHHVGIEPAQGGVVRLPDGSMRITEARSIWMTASDGIRDALKPLESEGIVQYVETDDTSWTQSVHEYFTDVFCESADPSLRDDPEILAIRDERDRVRRGDPACYESDFGGIIGLLASLCYARMIDTGATACTDSKLVLQLLARAHQATPKRRTSNTFDSEKTATLAMDILAAELPDLSFRSFEDVLEVRHRLRDDLGAFRVEMDSLAATLTAEPWTTDGQIAIDKLIRTKIRPAVVALDRKLATTRDTFLLTLVRNLKSPTSYVPLLATAFTNMPLAVAALASAGIFVADAAMETKRERRRIETENGIAFLLKAGQALAAK